MADQPPQEPLPEQPEEDAFIFNADGAMQPDHPLLARAQAALKRQLQAEQLRLQEELREKQIMVNVSVRSARQQRVQAARSQRGRHQTLRAS